MSLYGSLYSSVSGIKSQGTKIGVISDNISNVNTVGYKAGQANFKTLVTNSASTTSYSPGGVIAQNRQLVDKQGLLQATDSPTDIAISGNGFFVVNSRNDATGQVAYTRAGSFRQDSLGNFVNSQGFFLQGWPLDREGRLPGEPGNLNTISSAEIDSLRTVNVSQSGGVAAATTRVKLGINLDAKQSIYPGAGLTINMDPASQNFRIKGSSIVVPRDTTDTATLAPFSAGADGIAGTADDTGDRFTIRTANDNFTNTFYYGGFIESGSITATAILGASSVTQSFSDFTGFGYAANTVPVNTSNDAKFTIAYGATSGPATFTFKQTSPSAANGEFNSLQSLANAIDYVPGLTARVDANGRLYVSAEDATQAVTIANSGAVDWVSSFFAGDPSFTAGPPVTVSLAAQENRFNSMEGLAKLVNQKQGLTALVNNPLAEASLQIRAQDPLDTISFYDGADADEDTATAGGTGSILNMFGLATNSDYEIADTTNDTDGDGTVNAENSVLNLGPVYDAVGSNGNNMASGLITPQFSRSIRVYDSLGGGHDLRVGFIKIDSNQWAVEIFSPVDGDIVSSLDPSGRLVAYGNITFNGDGSLQAVSSDLLNPINIVWDNDDGINGAQPSQIAFNWGTARFPAGTPGATLIGDTDGMSQFESAYDVAFIEQNGASLGSLIGVQIDTEGFVIANYSNGESQRLFKIPVADFNNPNGLRSQSGNIFTETEDSGAFNLREATKSGMGEIVSGALEASNVELSEELTNLIIAQRAYQANTKVITTTDTLLEELTRL
jgi:flagellar hook protein FlgE